MQRNQDTRPAARRQLVQEPALIAGHFADTATALGDDLRVVSADHDDRQPFGPVVWMPIAGESGPIYPQDGDLAFIAEVRGEEFAGYVVTCWRPS